MHSFDYCSFYVHIKCNHYSHTYAFVGMYACMQTYFHTFFTCLQTRLSFLLTLLLPQLSIYASLSRSHCENFFTTYLKVKKKQSARNQLSQLSLLVLRVFFFYILKIQLGANSKVQIQYICAMLFWLKKACKKLN